MDDKDRADDGATWMLALQAGDVDAFDRIVHEYQNSCITSSTDSPAAAKSWRISPKRSSFRIYRARDRYRPDARFRTWLFTIVYNLCINFTKSRKLRRAPSLERRRSAEAKTASSRFEMW